MTQARDAVLRLAWRGASVDGKKVGGGTCTLAKPHTSCTTQADSSGIAVMGRTANGRKVMGRTTQTNPAQSPRSNI